MAHSARQRPAQPRLNTAVEIVCVLVVIAAVLALAVWIVVSAGGGVLNQG